MNIGFTNYKKVYTILGVFVGILLVTYTASVIVKNNRERSVDLKLEEQETKNIAGVPVVLSPGKQQKFTGEDMASVRAVFTEKSDFLIKSLINGSLDYRTDLAFIDVDNELVKEISSEIANYSKPIGIEHYDFFIAPDGLSAEDSVRIFDSAKTKKLQAGLIYVNKNDIWIFTNFFIKK